MTTTLTVHELGDLLPVEFEWGDRIYPNILLEIIHNYEVMKAHSDEVVELKAQLSKVLGELK